jgi:glycosyltransferase involved in cell wall biosynthesis
VFDTPVAREILGETGLYARLGSVEDLARGIEQLLDHQDLAVHLGIAARQRAVAELSWERAAQMIETIYADALARRHGR